MWNDICHIYISLAYLCYAMPDNFVSLFLNCRWLLFIWLLNMGNMKLPNPCLIEVLYLKPKMERWSDDSFVNHMNSRNYYVNALYIEYTTACCS